MIFVILGTQKFQFNRLLKLLEQYIDEGVIQEEVIAQVGYSDYIPHNFCVKRFFDKEEFDQMINKADLVITHGGVGTIITSNNLGKPTIALPRLKKYGEHVDDHQKDILEVFSKQGYILCCNEEDNLFDIIEKSRNMKFNKYVSDSSKILSIINEFLKNN